jgi:hypothetical protein
MSVHLDESEPTIRLESSLGNISKVLEQRNQVRLRRVRGEVTDVASGLPLGCLLNDHVIALDTVSREMMVTKWSGRGHSHRCHSLLLGDGGLTLLVSPIATDCTRAKPFAIHGAKRPLSLSAIAESHKPIATGAAGLHVPHDTGFRYVTKGGKRLQQNFIVDFVGKITNKDVEMVRGIFLCGVVRLVGPVDANFLIWSALPIAPS